MDEFAFKIWLGFGALCIIVELLIPGLVMIFLGLGAFSVAVGMHYGYIVQFSTQLTVFFLSSILYLFTLRVLFLRFIPVNAKQENIDEDEQVIGQIVFVEETIEPHRAGRIRHSDSSWPARSTGAEALLKGQRVRIIKRDNITWIVEKI